MNPLIAAMMAIDSGANLDPDEELYFHQLVCELRTSVQTSIQQEKPKRSVAALEQWAKEQEDK